MKIPIPVRGTGRVREQGIGKFVLGGKVVLPPDRVLADADHLDILGLNTLYAWVVAMARSSQGVLWGNVVRL